MENLNAEQIKKALECCYSNRACDECPYSELVDCRRELERSTLSLIKELTEENERLRAENEIKSQKRANIFEITNAFERGRTDGVRKMRERVRTMFLSKNTYYAEQVFSYIDQITKEMLEGAKE